MNNHHDIVYVKSNDVDTADREGLCVYDNKLRNNMAVPVHLFSVNVKPLKDVFVFTKEQLDKRDKEKWQEGWNNAAVNF